MEKAYIKPTAMVWEIEAEMPVAATTLTRDGSSPITESESILGKRRGGVDDDSDEWSSDLWE